MAMLKAAVIGLGWVGVNRHIAAISKSNSFELFGIVDRNESSVKDIAARFSVRNAAVRDCLSDIEWLGELDLLVVSTPPDSHFDLVSEALSFGLNVLTEKPFTMNVEQAEKLVAQAEANRKLLAIVHNFQFSNSFKHLLKDVEDGKLGKIKSVVARQFSNPKRRLPSWYDSLPYGLFYDESPHLLYLLNRLAPSGLSLRGASAIASTEGLNTPAIVEAVFASGEGEQCVPVSLHMSFEAPLSEWHLAVLGEESMGVVDLFRDIYIVLNNDESHLAKNVIKTSTYATLQHWFQTILRGVQHLSGSLLYGNDILYTNIAEAITLQKPLQYAGAFEAYEVLKYQHQIIQSTTPMVDIKTASGSSENQD